MTDRELLEAAAKAAGFRVHSWVVDDPYVIDTKSGLCDIWSPLEDDGDALRLANKLALMTKHFVGSVIAGGVDISTVRLVEVREMYADHGMNFDAATRRAIVRAAAAIGAAK